MPLNKAKGRMFKSVGWTWNPIVGCEHECSYCWAKALRDRWNKPFIPSLQESAFKDKFPEDGTIIFVGSMGDLFCDGMKDEWIRKVINKASESINNRFLFQTKNPYRFMNFMHDFDKIQQKVILGTTLETNRDTPWSHAPTPTERFHWLWYTTDEHAFRSHDLFLSLEPLSDFDHDTFLYMIREIEPIAVEIGLENYTQFTTPPSMEKIVGLLNDLDKYGINYILKENLNHLESSQFQVICESLEIEEKINKNDSV